MEAIDVIRVKELLPTTLGSDEIRERIAQDILRRSIFSARMASLPYLDRLREDRELLPSDAEMSTAVRTAMVGR